MYEVVNDFIDKEDRHLYRVGDVYPKEERKISKKRIEELSQEHPEYKCVFIKHSEKE